ncbi:hypothetical protein RND81_10G101600 [Saponaria officinalis]|uniref:RING-CH-type domain-containing protein n=1 Tax=Saponaria officinalis TaxID=3572 RepID=A0AAW1I0W1_SAPOF
MSLMLQVVLFGWAVKIYSLEVNDKLTQNEEKLNEGASTDSSSSPVKSHSSRASSASQLSVNDDLGLPTCRVCQCVESDKAGDSALGFLGIYTSLKDEPNASEQLEHEINTPENTEGSASTNTNQKLEPGYVKFVSPNGEVFICSTDLEMGACRNRDALIEPGYVKFVSPNREVFICSTDLEMGACRNRDALIELGCSCKNDLALVHYACALKWFVSHGSTMCEICGSAATNIKDVDFKKVLASLKEYEALRDMTASEAANPAQVHDDSGVDPDAIAAIRRLRLSEIYLWFNPPVTPPEHPATKWAVEGTGILLATGLLTVILAWLIAPRVGAKTAKNGLHILLGGVCALAVVVFFRIFCTHQNQVWTSTMLGDLVCILVSYRGNPSLYHSKHFLYLVTLVDFEETSERRRQIT